ncbi:hypothetical protein PIB30_085133 [Stylosanthes scabra]|uniref:Protein kinase domain-containing protein n=1 Tax=Stylosanthes scabra TaxID=79078 RepID=A0ABU6VSK9_9FABA|nr:hypothetical protein [Stylosanthes scabra]
MIAVKKPHAKIYSEATYVNVQKDTRDGRKNGTKCCHNDNYTKGYQRISKVALGVCGVVIVLLVASFYMYRKRKKTILIKLQQRFFQQNGGLLLQQQIASYKGSNQTTPKIFTVEELQDATNNFDEARILGKGGQGTVYKGVLTDDNIVAIKRSKLNHISQVEQFINEVVLLSQINHRNVVKLLGCCLETEVPLLVYEYVSNGTVYDHLHHDHDYSQSFQLDWKVRLQIATEAAGALAYLHFAASMPIIHRDVKISNILLDHNLTTKVSDFGTLRIISLDHTQLTTLMQGTLGYLDPEYFHTSHLTEKSDVYSFGVVLAELLTGRKALSFALPEMDRNLALYFISFMEQGNLLQIVDTCILEVAKVEELIEFANITKWCLRVKGEERPTMKEVAMGLERLRIEEKINQKSSDLLALKKANTSASTFQIEDDSGGQNGASFSMCRFHIG